MKQAAITGLLLCVFSLSLTSCLPRYGVPRQQYDRPHPPKKFVKAGQNEVQQQPTSYYAKK